MFEGFEARCNGAAQAKRLAAMGAFCIALVFFAPFASAIDIAACGNLGVQGATYVLTQDIIAWTPVSASPRTASP